MFVSWAKSTAADIRPGAWRESMARRNANISRLVRAAQRELGPAYAGKTKRGAVWSILATVGQHVVTAVTIAPPRLRTFRDFKQPMLVTVKRPDLVSPVLLEARLRARQTKPTVEEPGVQKRS